MCVCVCMCVYVCMCVCVYLCVFALCVFLSSFPSFCSNPCIHLGHSTPVLLWSSRSRPQAWHLDSPLPNVFANLVYLDDGQMTQFMVPCALSSSILEMKAPTSEPFCPCGIGSDEGKIVEDPDSPLISENWLEYLEKR